MVTRRQALAVGSPTLLMLLDSLAWNAWAYREQLLDRAVRVVSMRHD